MCYNSSRKVCEFMELKGKIINFLGDSITFGSGVIDMNNRYDNVIKARCGLKAVNNHGIGGTRIAYQPKASLDPKSDLYFCGRAYTMPLDADINVVFGGTNDYGHGNAPFGEMTDKTPDTFLGAVDFLINMFREYYPNSTLVFMTPARRLGDEKPAVHVYKIPSKYVLKDYVDGIIAKCREYNVPVLNLYDELGIDPNIESDNIEYTKDGLHFNDKGHAMIADKLIRFLESL